MPKGKQVPHWNHYGGLIITRITQSKKQFLEFTTPTPEGQRGHKQKKAMGTRNLTIVIIDGETKIAQYGQWDGYPAGQGKTILSFLKRIDAAGEWQKFKDRIRTLKWLTPEQCEELDKDPDWDKKHPYLSRDCGGQILDAVYFGTMETGSNYDNTRKEEKVEILGLGDQSNFLTDGLFCEWAYRIDLDKETFEILRSGDNVIKTYQLSELPALGEFLAIEKEA